MSEWKIRRSLEFEALQRPELDIYSTGLQMRTQPRNAYGDYSSGLEDAYDVRTREGKTLFTGTHDACQNFIRNK
jgi:hypothetical protein